VRLIKRPMQTVDSTTTLGHSEHRLLLVCIFIMLAFTACSQRFTVSVNDQAVYDPDGRLLASQLSDPNLQGCANYAMSQQELLGLDQLPALSCADSEVGTLDNINQLSRLRFLDLSNNNISNITPLEDLRQLSGVNLSNNQLRDASPLLNIATLVSANLSGNIQIPCEQLAALEKKLGDNFQAPQSCRN